MHVYDIGRYHQASYLDACRVRLMKVNIAISIISVVLALIVMAPAKAEQNTGVILNIDVAIDPEVADIETLKHVALGGYTPSWRPTMPMLEKLSRTGFRSLRMINIEWDNIARVVDGDFVEMRWSKKLERELRMSRELGLTPHIIVGQIIPDGMQISGSGNDRRGVSDWDLYRKYLVALMDHVVDDWGFRKVIWEVGNEMDNHKFNWVPERKLDIRLHPEGYQAYLRLYTFIANEIQRYRTLHPEVEFLVGGPALTQNSANHPPGANKNWLVRFASDIARHRIPCDFFSMHFYGSAGTRDELISRISDLQKAGEQDNRVLPPIWITEWGTSAFFQHENENFLPAAAAFSLDFIKTAADTGVENTLFIAAARHSDENKSGPALLNRDGTTSYAMDGIDVLLGLTGDRVKCYSDNIAVGCIAVLQGNRMAVVYWHTDWASNRMGARRSLGAMTERQYSVSIRINGDERLVESVGSNNYRSLDLSMNFSR